MDTTVITFLVAVLAIASLFFAAWYNRRMNSRRLRQRFGSEYDEVVRKHGSRRRAEAELAQREQRVSKYSIVPLPPHERARYSDAWMKIQSQFVDQPEKAVAEADRLVHEIMTRRGYPVTGFEQAAADLSVDHPGVVENYRAAYRIVERSRRGAASTEELREAIVRYRALFDDLVETEPAKAARATG